MIDIKKIEETGKTMMETTKKGKHFECKYCKQKYPMKLESIDPLIAHMKTHNKMNPILENLTNIALKHAVDEKHRL